MDKVTVREIRTDECAAVLQLWQLIDSKSAVTDTLDYLQDLINRAGDLLLVAEIAGQIIGTVLGAWDGWRGHIYRLVVHPDYRHQGIAHALVQEVELRLHHKGARRIYALSNTKEGVLFWSASRYEATTDTAFVRTYQR
ncbi:MAG: GNAT family N-acetyltransferase [Steroidobacteraceae bacterium]